MLNRHTRVRAIITTLGLLGAMIAVQATFPSAAQARCNGVDNAITSTLNIISGVPAVSEVPVTGTCNDNNYYQADFRSHHAGWRASVWIEKNGWIGYFGPYGTGWEHYSYTDNNTPVEGSTLIHFCLDNGATWYCGWGNNYTTAGGVTHNFSGVNHGF